MSWLVEEVETSGFVSKAAGFTFNPSMLFMVKSRRSLVTMKDMKKRAMP